MKENNAIKRIFAGVLTGGMFLLSSCGLIEMRDPYTDDDLTVEATAEMSSMLAPAERKNAIGVTSAFETAEVNRTTADNDDHAVSLALTGDVRIDGSIIRDAANRAADGKSYSFLRMYAGIFGRVSGADVAFGSYSAAKNPAGDTDVTHKTPVESLAALSDLGYELLDTTEAGDLSATIGKYDMEGLSADVKADDSIRLIERNGITIAFVSMGDQSHRHSYAKTNMAENIEYAAMVSDLTVVSVNWGEGMSAEEKREIAEQMAQLGADVIVGDGDRLETIEWLDTGDGSPTLTAYSLGAILSSADEVNDLCAGVLTFDISTENGSAVPVHVCLTPTVIHYTGEKTDYQIFELSSYTDELAVMHAVPCVSCDGLLSFVRGTVPNEFLPSDLRG